MKGMNEKRMKRENKKSLGKWGRGGFQKNKGQVRVSACVRGQEMKGERRSNRFWGGEGKGK